MTASPETPERILDVAEALFAEHGFHATSLRAITSAAGANLAAVNYHFGSKDGLVLAVLQRRFAPINAERLRRLEAAEATGQPALRAVLAAFLEPCLALCADDERAPIIMRLLARLHGEPEVAGPVLRGIFPELVRRFLTATQRACPHLSAATVLHRFQFILGALVHGMISRHALRCAAELGLDQDDSPSQMIEALLTFGSAGFAAPEVFA